MEDTRSCIIYTHFIRNITVGRQNVAYKRAIKSGICHMKRSSIHDIHQFMIDMHTKYELISTQYELVRLYVVIDY